MAQFVGIIHKDRSSDFGVSFPDFPGCITAGKTMQEAYEMAGEALRGHIETMAQYGDSLPARPITLDTAKKHKFAKSALTFFMIEAHLPSRSKRINITMDEDLIRAIDRVSQNRSEFLAKAAWQQLQHI